MVNRPCEELFPLGKAIMVLPDLELHGTNKKLVLTENGRPLKVVMDGFLPKITFIAFADDLLSTVLLTKTSRNSGTWSSIWFLCSLRTSVVATTPTTLLVMSAA